ncbi:hypothetical protein J1N35_011962 [Gossypium stocksii]|uniref:Uncharacterized protein n=1 Tax=Gossypium stocksii TaxID=47602 RepID=A0A9D4ADT5_9ROSI|nr:hypothetical protein J1N35_011962 [Gossypium stocksii]
MVDGDRDSRLSKDRNTKKVRFKDDSDGASVDMAIDSDPSLNAATSRRRSGDSQDSSGIAARKGRLSSRFNVLNVKGKRTGGKEWSTNANFRGLNANAVEYDLNSLDSREEDNIKSVTYPYFKAAKKYGLNSDSQKKTCNPGLESEAQKNITKLVAERIGGGVHVGQEMKKEGNFGNHFDSKLQARKLNDIKAHFNLAFESPVEVEVQLTDNILDHGKHSAVTFKNSSNFPNQYKCRTFEPISAGNTRNKDRKGNEKYGITRGGRKNSNVLKGHGSQFKTFVNSWVSLVNSMKEVGKLISSNLSNEAEMGVLAESGPSGLNNS